ncbi:MAG: CapA family protein [Ruminococcaceae bacterium]|nr:CapA family protein [Oscillospiraceae bacterium]
MHKHVAAVLLCCLLGCSGCQSGFWPHIQTAPVLSVSSADPCLASIPIEDAPLSTVTMSFVGDVMLASEYSLGIYGTFNGFAASTEPDYYFSRMQEIFASDDWTVANGENVFIDEVKEMAVKDYTPAYWYCSGTENAQIYPAGSVEIVSMANNHALDFGWVGYTDTIAALENAGVTPVGEKEWVVLEKDGFRVGLLCCSLYSNYYLTGILEWLESAVTETDYQIVYFHGGTERVHEPEDWKIAACRAMVDAGADLVLGNHPHVLQPREIYNGAEIVYSLGNFLFGGSRNCENVTIVYRLTLEVTEGEVTKHTSEIIPCYCYDELWQPCPMEDPAEIQAVLDFMEGRRELPY